MLSGSAQPLSTSGSTSSTLWPSPAVWAGVGACPAAHRRAARTGVAMNPMRISLALHAQALILSGAGGLGFGFLLGRATTLQRAVGPRPQIDIEIIEMTNDILIGSKGRHHALLRGIGDRSAVHHDILELLVGHGLERVGKRRS